MAAPLHPSHCNAILHSPLLSWPPSFHSLSALILSEKLATLYLISFPGYSFIRVSVPLWLISQHPSSFYLSSDFRKTEADTPLCHVNKNMTHSEFWFFFFSKASEKYLNIQKMLRVMRAPWGGGGGGEYEMQWEVYWLMMLTDFPCMPPITEVDTSNSFHLQPTFEKGCCC